MENNVDFDELAQKFLAARGEETYCNLFGAVFELEQWQFIAVGEPPNFSPYCAVFPGFMEGQPTVLAFTDTERLNKYVKSKNLKFGSADQPVVINSPAATVTFSSEDLILGVPTTSVVNYLERLMTEKGVKWIVFNQDKDSTGFQLELARLRETKELVDGKKSKIKAESEAEQRDESTAKTDFDALNRKSNQSGGARADLDNLFGATFALEKWLFIARGEMPNVNPYIAANAEYADGQQMIRAFTDSNRLQRFAKENNLTDADGSAQMLEIPTSGAVEFLEQFIPYSVHGVWFNSDTESGGYFIPLKQLRPIKEHLVNIGWKPIEAPANLDLPHDSGFVAPANSAQKSCLEIVVVIVRDGLMLPSGVYSATNYACNLYCLVPREWTENGKLKDAYLERFYEKFYGVTWRAGNEDGSRFVVDHSFTMVLTPEDSQGADWTTLKDDEKNHYFFYVAADNGEIKSVKPPEFQQEFIASRQTPAPSPPPPSNLENFGLSQTPGGEPDLRIKLFKQGNVKFDSSIVPFFAAVQPLLRDYQGFGNFRFIFDLIPEAMKNIHENVPGNDHGKYFRVRKFQYHPPNGKAVSEMQTLDSNQLRHVQTGATLSMSFALVQLLGDSAASLYFEFEGGNIEVQRLLKAVAPALEAAGFVDQQAGNNSPAQPAAAVDKNVAADKDAVDYIDWFRRGTVKPDTSFKPFFQAIAPLLADYAGAGEFEFSFATGSDEPGMRDLFEDVSSNSHGAYLKYRSYIFEPYEMQMIGSNRLTNVRTGEKLRIQLTMHKNLAEGKTTLIVVFVGRPATVETLENAVKSALDDAEYTVQLKLKKPATTETLQSIGVQG